MSNKKERGICEMYEKDAERADAVIWDRKVDPVSRRGFLRNSGLAAMTAALGASIPFAHLMPGGIIPAAFAETHESFQIAGKKGLTILNDRPINAETPPHLLNDIVTPISKHYVRNNGLIPESAKKMDATGWNLTIDGEVNKTLVLNLDDLKNNFKNYTYQLQLECGGNGRAGFNPPVKGNQWTLGAVACSEYKGVRLGDVLKAAGLKSSASWTAYYGRDVHLSGNPDKETISRGTPIAKAMDKHTLLAFEMNGEALPVIHGFPVRIVCPGWPGSFSGKWLKRIWIRDRVHDGTKMTGKAYRVPKNPVPPAAKVDASDMEFYFSMPVKSLITSHKSGVSNSEGKTFKCGGQAWAGDFKVKAVDVTIDFGATWIKTKLKSPNNPFAWQRWEASIDFPKKGYYEVWARATDSEGRAQPMVVPGWNPKGYLNNSMHRIAVKVT